MDDFVRWIEIDLDAIIHNYHQIRDLVPHHVKIMAVVKANAYGHGAVEVAQALEEAGADMFAVTTVEEGMELRQNGIRQPILVFVPMLPFQVETVMEEGLIPTIDNLDSLDSLIFWAKKQGTKVKFHLKVETGMGRTGVFQEQIPLFFQKIRENPELEMHGIYSHFATAMMADKTYARKQFALFSCILEKLRKEGTEIGLAHIANSAAVLDLPETYLDMVRVGTLLYGQYPSEHVSHQLILKDPWQVKAKIVSVKKLQPGDSVGYGRDYLVKRPIEVGIIPIGYADGFAVLPHTRPAKTYDLIKSMAETISQLTGLVQKNFVFQGKEKISVVGRIGMQLSMIDITGRDLRPGDEVSVPMRRTTSSARLPRIFLKNQAVWKIC